MRVKRSPSFIPKFKSEWMRKWFIPSNRSRYFSIHLDEMGSKVWNLIDGETNTGEICSKFSSFCRIE